MHMALSDSTALQAQLKCFHSSNLLFVIIRDYALFKEMYGNDFVGQLDRELNDSLVKTAQEQYGESGVSVFTQSPGEYILLCPDEGDGEGGNLCDIAYAFKLQAQNAMKRTMLKWTGLGIELGIGYSCIESNGRDWDMAFSHAIKEARLCATQPLDLQSLEITKYFNQIVHSRTIRCKYQPILDFRTGNICGWEALARGPQGSPFESPLVMFELAEQIGRLFSLEEVCREKAIRNLGPIAAGQRLFLNIHPKTMADPAFTPGKTLALLQEVGLSPKNIVFEITERHSLQDFSLFYRTLDHYRSQGFQIALDDTGSGYSGLSSIAELHPEFIKLDKSLIHNIHRDPVKRALVETTVTFADKIKSRIVAEGIETRDQAVCLMDIGVHCGQGYYLGYPEKPKPELSPECRELQSMSELPRKTVTCSIPIGEIAEAPYAVDSSFIVADAQDFFSNNQQFPSIVVTEDNVPRGLVMEYHLNRQLSSQYGVALFSKRSITDVMDESPLIVDKSTPVEQAARMAMDRETLKAYDEVIITRKGVLFGVVTVQKLLNTLARVQVEMARGTNPLTGLPGNVALEQEVESRITRKDSFCIIYGDLDHFKVYNDTYGFKNGDAIIKLAADIMSWAATKHCPKDSLLCHIGGDDFVLITKPESVEKTCISVLRCFKRLVNRHYSAQDRDRGWIHAKGRDGKKRQYPLVSISLGVIEIQGQCTLMEIGERAADIKKYAKSIAGNAYAKDRRTPLGCPVCV
ncbi:GGDEF domain-containing protein [Salidesulfovibrio onnuriiensis]|uniref:GGDEF domain-containing protein n=1 Tax=Salidesulfovibrio onnuriiensis TaxID=2583823 RepID=UPI0011C81203|nr:bifunctional diguanylate cyclase/phosphodiesterase [Salidesulfovibrio onnuriiensis]